MLRVELVYVVSGVCFAVTHTPAGCLCVLSHTIRNDVNHSYAERMGELSVVELLMELWEMV